MRNVWSGQHTPSSTRPNPTRGSSRPACNSRVEVLNACEDKSRVVFRTHKISYEGVKQTAQDVFLLSYHLRGRPLTAGGLTPLPSSYLQLIQQLQLRCHLLIIQIRVMGLCSMQSATSRISGFHTVGLLQFRCLTILIYRASASS